jgi:CRP/FNR family transcriptional regulator, cyclic AMP receptor protein
MKELPVIADLKLLEIVNRIPFFRDFTPPERQYILKNRAQFIAYHKNEPILREGSEDTEFYVVLSGEVVIKKSGHDRVLGIVHAGQFLGENSFLTSQPRSASAIANSGVIALRICQQSLRELPVSIRERIKDSIIIGMASRLAELNNRLVQEKIDSEIT